MKSSARTPYDADAKHGFIDSQRKGMEVFKHIDPNAPAHRRRSGLAILASRPRRTHDPSRADSHGRQLVRHVARPRRHVESEWLAHEAGREVLHALERGFHRRLFQSRNFASGSRPANARTRPTTSSRSPRSKSPATRASWAKRSPPQLRREKAIMGVFDEGCMGMFNAIIPDDLLHATGVFKERLSQSALYYESHAASATPRRGRSTTWFGRARHEVPHRPERRHRSDRRADSLAVQDVHRRRAHRR